MSHTVATRIPRWLPDQPLTLADIARDRWTHVATSTQPGSWDWLLSSRDAAALLIARERGDVVTTQVRVCDGVYRLLARRAG